MNLHIVRNKYLNTLLLLMLLSAIVHMVILCYVAMASQDVYILNYFNILDIDLFFPAAVNSALGNVTSLIFVVGLYGFILTMHHNKSAE